MLKFKPGHFRHLQIDDQAFRKSLYVAIEKFRCRSVVSASNEKASSNRDSAFRTEASSSTMATRACRLHMRDSFPKSRPCRVGPKSMPLNPSTT